MGKNEPLLEALAIGKSFPGVCALRQVNLSIGPSECVALLGENGAGKSTLMKILAGVQTPTEGEIRIHGKPVSILSVLDGLRHGIALIHQELNLAANLSAAENIFLGREPRKWGLIDSRRMRDEARVFLEMVGLNIDPDAQVGSFTIGRQQLVEIAKALSVNARILIMDEPTSSLSQGETERLFTTVEDLKRRGVSIIYITHRLREVERLADRAVVLRDGVNVGELKRKDLTHDRMVSLMVGRELSQFYPHSSHVTEKPGLAVSGLVTPRFPGRSSTFSVHCGEIVGVAGLVGAGRSELLEALFGVHPALAGEIQVTGQTVKIDSPGAAVASGLALVPEDRKRQGLILDMTVRENLSLCSLRRDQQWGFRDRDKESAISQEMIAKLNIKTPGEGQRVRFLSGGNQQKVVLGKWLALKPRVLLLDEPTRGIDIGAKQEIYGLMEEMAARGVAILFVSSEMEEILGMSDRVLVMHEGRIAGELNRENLSEEAVMRLATGAV